jgi:hypothetical protein
MSNTVVRIFKHEESFEVRVSTFFYFDDHPGRRAITKRMTPEAAEQATSLREGPARWTAPAQTMIKRKPLELPPKTGSHLAL